MLVSPEAKRSGIAAKHGAENLKARSSREHAVAAITIVTSSLTFFLLQYNRFRDAEVGLHQWAAETVAGRVFAPDVYRVGIAWLTLAIQRVVHVGVNQSLPMIECACFGLALFFLYILLRQLNSFCSGTPAYRAVMLAFFLAISQLPVLWIFPWERAETLPTALYVAAVVLLASARAIPFAAAFAGICLLTLVQGFLRAEVPTEIGIAFVVAAVFRAAAPRRSSQMAALGIATGVIGFGAQFYIQKVLYPHVTYAPGVPRIQLIWNLRPFWPPDHLPIFFCAMTPLLFTLMLLRTKRIKLEPVEALIVLICLLYLPIWWIGGLVSEARIYLPFLLLASPVMARIWSSFLLPELEPGRTSRQ